MKRLFLVLLAILCPLIAVYFLLVPHNTFLDNKTPADDSGALWYVNTDLLDDYPYADFYGFGDDFLLIQQEPKSEHIITAHIQKISSKNGAVLKETEISMEEYAPVQIFSDSVVITNPFVGRIWILDKDLNIQQEYSLSPSDTGYYLSPDLTTLYEVAWDKGLSKTDLSTMESTLIVNGRDLFCNISADNSKLILSYNDSHTQVQTYSILDLQTGALTTIPVNLTMSMSGICGNLWFSYCHNRSESIFLGDENGIICSYDIPQMGISFTPKGELLCTGQKGKMAIYSADGELLHEVTPTNINTPDVGNSPLVWSETYQGYFFLLYPHYMSDSAQLMFWDTSTPVQGEPLKRFDYSALLTPPVGSAVAPELYERARTLSETYGVTIRIADQCDTDYTDFTTYTVTDPVIISMALDNLEDALQKYPAGFFRQLHYGTVQQVEINLTGGLKNKEHFNLDSALAFAEPLYDKYIIVADIYLVTEQDFHHEFSHIIDSRLEWDTIFRPEAKFSEQRWAERNPTDFVYTCDYGNYLQNFNVDMDYFIDSYATTYPTEDRARIWEHAMMNHQYILSPSPLRAKLQYYCDCIRDCFDTTGWPEVTVWEQTLQS